MVSRFYTPSKVVTYMSPSIFINIGYTMKLRGLQGLDFLYKHLHAKCKAVYGFQGDLNPTGREGFIA